VANRVLSTKRALGAIPKLQRKVGAIFFAGMTIVGSQTGAAEPVANSIRRACAAGGLCWALGIGRQLSAMCGVD